MTSSFLERVPTVDRSGFLAFLCARQFGTKSAPFPSHTFSRNVSRVFDVDSKQPPTTFACRVRSLDSSCAQRRGAPRRSWDLPSGQVTPNFRGKKTAAPVFFYGSSRIDITVYKYGSSRINIYHIDKLPYSYHKIFLSTPQFFGSCVGTFPDGVRQLRRLAAACPESPSTFSLLFFLFPESRVTRLGKKWGTLRTTGGGEICRTEVRTRWR